MELHFCSQCGISIPLTEVQSGAAAAGEGRYVCAEHRPGAKTAVAVEAPPGDPNVELLFCANCSVSIPVADAQSGRARREFGSILCASCSAGDTGLRERRKKAVELEMTAARTPPAAPEVSRRCTVCAASVPDSQISAGRALVEGNRVVCGRCREAGAVPVAAASGSGGGGAGNVVLWIVLLAAVAVAGFFATKHFKESSATRPQLATAADLKQTERDLDLRLSLVEQSLATSAQRPEPASQEALDLLREQLSSELLDLREHVADTRGKLSAADGDLAQRLARAEGQIAGMQEMIKGLAARPAPEKTAREPDPPPKGPDGGGAKPPEGPPPEKPVVPQPDAEVTKLLKDLLESQDPGVRFAGSVELIRRKERSAIPAFAKVVLEDANVMVRRSAARGLGELKAWFAVPVLIAALEDKEAYVAAQASFALEAITGENFNVTTDDSLRDRKVKAAAARKWWEKNKDNPPDGACLEPVELVTK